LGVENQQSWRRKAGVKESLMQEKKKKQRKKEKKRKKKKEKGRKNKEQIGKTRRMNWWGNWDQKHTGKKAE